MASGESEKFVVEVSPQILARLRSIARNAGRSIDSLVEEGLTDLIEKRQHSNPRDRVISAYRASHEKFAPLYKKLAE